MKQRGTAERFWSKVDKATEGCWLWLAGKDSYNYGTFRSGSLFDGSRKMMKAHRVAWQLANGKIPDGLYVLHRCDNPSCCNPAHLFLGTIADNNLDASKKGRGIYPDNRGERHGMAKLSKQQVLAIRAQTGSSTAALAKSFNVTTVTIRAIVRGTTWRHLMPADYARQ